ncbi:MAG: TIR domain-containing protein [Verrucomicrobiales bacterium]|nr:TIR domain-containing protein [Verrucomicrobiales bacterium]
MTRSVENGRSQDPKENFKYDAFISYGHAADRELAPALQKGLQVFAKPWYQLRALRIFRDATGLAVTPELWGSIESALARSRFFLLLASPKAAQSQWVAQEVHWWLAHRSVSQFLIVLTDGEVVWDAAAGDFDWVKTNALPPAMQRAFPEEPLHLDLRWAKTSSQLSLRRPEFADAVARLSATLRGISLDEIIGEEVRQHHRTMRWARGVGLALLGVAAAAILAGVLALQAKRMVKPLTRERETQAAEQANQAISARLAAQANELAATHQELAILLAVEAVRALPNAASERALRSALFEVITPVTRFDHGTDSSCYAVFHPDGNRVLTYGTPMVRLRDALSGTVQMEFRGHTNDVTEARFDRDGRRLCTSEAVGEIRLWETDTGRVLASIPKQRPGTTLLSPNATRMLLLEEGGGGALWDATKVSKIADIDFYSTHQFLADRVSQASFSADGERLAVLTRGGNASVINVKTGEVVHELSDHTKPVTSVAFDPEGRWMVTSSDDGTLRRWRSDTGKCEAIMEHDLPVRHAAFSPDRQWIAAVDESRAVIVWEATTGRRSQRIETRLNPEAPIIFNFSPNGTCILTAGYEDDQAVLWETTSGRRLAEFEGEGRDGPLRSLSFAAHGKHVVVGTLLGRALVYPTEIGGSLQDLLALANRRVSRQLTAEEREKYQTPTRR